MGTFAVFNLHDDVRGQTVFATHSEDDIFSEIYVSCVARVYVESASWKELYRGPGMLHEPCMELKGKVASVFFEENDQRVFPCGVKELLLKDITSASGFSDSSRDYPQQVRFHWHFECSEQNNEMELVNT